MVGTVDIQALQTGNAGWSTASYAKSVSSADRSQPGFQSVLRECLEHAVAGDTAASCGASTNTATVGAASGVSDGVAGDRQASAQLVDFVAAHEGYSATAYRGADVQNQTIGYGHVVQTGESTASLSRTQALSLLQNDLKSSVSSVNQEFAGVDLTQSQFDALVSFSYNLGDHIWSRATQLTADIKSGASADTLRSDFVRFNHCNGRELTGLTNRRVDEWDMYANGQYRTDI